jgi:hypothetical protein
MVSHPLLYMVEDSQVSFGVSMAAPVYYFAFCCLKLKFECMQSACGKVNRLLHRLCSLY